MIEQNNKRKYPLHKYEIWIGFYHWGQGEDPSEEPKLLAEVVAPNFNIACLIYELNSQLNRINYLMKADEYVDKQSCRNFYNFDKNTGAAGKYFETKEEALETFK